MSVNADQTFSGDSIFENIYVHGKLVTPEEAVTIFTLLGDSNFKNNSEFKNLETKHKNILESYFNQRWEDCLQDINSAKTLCNNLMEDYYNIMSLRINEFRENPLPKDWDGVYIATSK